MQFSEQQILQLAPDDASIKAGKSLSAPSNWLLAANNDRVLWGEIKGSGSKPYLTQIDLQNLAFKCSCPSRKFPCKHGLGLMLLTIGASQTIQKNLAEPTWVSDWMDKRQTKATKSEEKTEKEAPADEKGKEKRELDRLKAVEAGINELDLVINDLVRHGLMHLNGLSNDFFSNLAKRMIDSKATGLANRIEVLNELRYSINQKQTQHQFLEQLAELNFIIRSFQNRNQLDEISLESLKVSIGWNQAPKALIEDKSFETVKDHWLIAGQTMRERENMKIQTTYLIGKNTTKTAQILQFSINNQAMELLLPVENELEAGLVFFPHLIPFRAVIRIQNGTQTCHTEAYRGLSNLEEAIAVYTSKIELFPLHFESLCIVNQLRIGQINQQFVALDSENHFLPIDEEAFPISKQMDWLAKTEGKAFKTALLIRSNKIIPIGVFIHFNYHSL